MKVSNIIDTSNKLVNTTVEFYVFVSCHGAGEGELEIATFVYVAVELHQTKTYRKNAPHIFCYTVGVIVFRYM